MRVIDVYKPHAAILYARYLAARRCPNCGEALVYIPGKPRRMSQGRRGTPVELRCPNCELPPADAFIIPRIGANADMAEENFRAEMELLADVTLKVRSDAVEKVEGIRLAPETAITGGNFHDKPRFGRPAGQP